MELEADIIEFRVPSENNKTLFIWGIQPSLTEAHIYVSSDLDEEKMRFSFSQDPQPLPLKSYIIPMC